MLFETLSQPTTFLWLSLSGFLCGFLFDITSTILHICKKNRFIFNIFAFFATFFVLFLFFLINLHCNYGEIRFFSIFAFAISFTLQRYLSKNFIAKVVLKWYNNHNEKRTKRKTKEKHV